MGQKAMRPATRVTRARSANPHHPLAGEEYTRVLLCDPEACAEFIEDRQNREIDHFDEVWEGVYVVSPIADIEHQELAGLLLTVFQLVVGWTGLGKVLGPVNVSDRKKGWT